MHKGKDPPRGGSKWLPEVYKRAWMMKDLPENIDFCHMGRDMDMDMGFQYLNPS